MEKWQEEHITKNLKELITLTKFNCIVKAELVANGILNQTTDVDWLDAQEKQHGASAACGLYYKMLTGRTGAYKVLYNALVETNQSGAYQKLIRVPPELFSTPLTYLGISTEVDEFKNVEIIVNGKTFKMHEFFPHVNYKLVERIFYENIHEVEFYDSFVTKEKKFVLTKNNIPSEHSYYVPRFLSNRIKLDKSIFKTECDDVFVFKNSIERYKLSEIVHPHFTANSTSQLSKIFSRFIYLDENDDWPDLKKSAKVPIHLLNYETELKIFILEDTSGLSDILRKFVSKNSSIYISEDEFVQQQLSKDCKSSSVCICDTPGMGKTLLLANLARTMTEKSGKRIVLFISLTTFSADFFQHTGSNTPNSKAYILRVLKCISVFSRNFNLILKLLEANLLFIEMFFDGFDEVQSDKVEWFKSFFKSITSEFTHVKIYITSRPHMRKELEDSLGVLAYDILPFNRQNQIDFLVQYWSQEKINTNPISLQNYAKSCLEVVMKSLCKNDKDIAGIPLLCKLIAEVYESTTPRNRFDDVPVKLPEIYQKFIEQKINTVSKNSKEFQSIKLAHIWHALKLLFPNHGFLEEDLFNCANDLVKLEGCILKVGIIQQGLNTPMEFVHRTFAEYLVADYFSTKLDTKTENNLWIRLYRKSRQKLVIITSAQWTRRYNQVNKCDIVPIFKVVLNSYETVRKNAYEDDYKYQYPVIVSFINSFFDEITIYEKAKNQLALIFTFISSEHFITMLCACYRQNFYNIFSLLKEVMAICGRNWIREHFTIRNSFKILFLCIKHSTSEMFISCIQLFEEQLQLDMLQVLTSKADLTLLQVAVRRLNYEAVEYLVGKGVSLKRQKIVETCVSSSCWDDTGLDQRVNILYLLLNKDPTLAHESPNILASEKIHLKLIKVLIKFGIKLYVKEGKRFVQNCAVAAAHYLPAIHYHEFVQILLNECKAECLFLENENWTNPLPPIIRWATILPETLDLLLNINGMDINMKDEKGETLLFIAVVGDKVDNFQQLVNRGLDYNARGDWNKSLLHIAAVHAGVEMIKYLLSLGLDPTACTENKSTPLHYAAIYYRRISIFQVLVENGAQVQAKNDKGQTPLHLSAQKSNKTVEQITYLINKRADVDDRDVDENTPLHLCTSPQNRDCLIEMGANIYAKNNMDQTPAQVNPDLWKNFPWNNDKREN